MDEKYHLVLTQACGIRALAVARLLPDLHCSAVIDEGRQLDQSLAGAQVDALICAVSEAEELLSVFGASPCAVLLLGAEEETEKCLPWAIANGFLCGSRDQFSVLFPQLLSVSCRLRSLRIREHSLQRKLSDTKLVNRAKLLLVTRLQMTEAEAHRYIEKTAMDNGESRRDVALRLIRTYEE